jgi:hypothetical protein
MVLRDDAAFLVLGATLRPWGFGGYGLPVPRPRRGTAEVITPPSLVHILGNGWDPVVPLLHPSAAD